MNEFDFFGRTVLILNGIAMLFHTLTVNHHGKMDDPILNDFEYQSEL
jgi:hypothetical protein